MNQELAEQLEKAGFPQGLTVDDVAVFTSRGENPPIKVPTLGDLIEACAPDFQKLETMPHRFPEYRWQAIASNLTEEEKEVWASRATAVGHGPTPVDAAANLWLALNKK